MQHFKPISSSERETMKLKDKNANTYIDLLPLADVSDEPGEAEQPDEAEQLGKPEDPKGSASMQNLEA
jgi:hypothetical protein